MINICTIVGRLTADVEISKTNGGSTVAKFSLANNRYYNGEQQTTFINCVAWNKTAENMAVYTHKGQLVGVVGRISARSYTAEDGTKRTFTEVIANEVHFLERKTDGVKTEESEEPEEIDNEELPF